MYRMYWFPFKEDYRFCFNLHEKLEEHTILISEFLKLKRETSVFASLSDITYEIPFKVCVKIQRSLLFEDINLTNYIDLIRQFCYRQYILLLYGCLHERVR